MSQPLLPQHDPASDARIKALDEQRERYQYTFDKYRSLPMLADLPKEEKPPKAWSQLLNRSFAEALKNAVKADRKGLGSIGGFFDRIGEVAASFKDLAADASLQELGNDFMSLILAGGVTGRARSIDDFAEFFQTVPTPEVARRWQDDDWFSAKAVRGANPESLERVKALDDRFPVTDAMLAQVSDGDSLEAALAEGRLFTSDYGMLAHLAPNDVHGPRRYTYAPRVMYVVPPGQGSLKVFAIQVAQDPAEDNPVFTPADGMGWALAKVHASTADTITGALWFHHARTHIVAEPCVISLHRHLSVRHPLMRLLLPHYAGTLYINDLGFGSVFAPHGLLDWFTGGSRESVREMVVQSVRTFQIEESVVPRYFAARGIDDADVLKDFPYRDDATLLFAAIREWVAEYVGIYYTNDGELLADLELQSWLAEITAPDAGGLQGIGQGGAFRTRAYLVDILTQLIYAGSAQHAAMNFPVASEMGFVPNSPFAVYQTRPTRKDGWTQDDLLATLPPLDAAQRQFATAWLLGSARFGALGYDDGWFTDPRVTLPLDRFRVRLAQVEATIDERNLSRPAYIHLKPSRVPPSINI